MVQQLYVRVIHIIPQFEVKIPTPVRADYQQRHAFQVRAAEDYTTLKIHEAKTAGRGCGSQTPRDTSRYDPDGYTPPHLPCLAAHMLRSFRASAPGGRVGKNTTSGAAFHPTLSYTVVSRAYPTHGTHQATTLQSGSSLTTKI